MPEAGVQIYRRVRPEPLMALLHLEQVDTKKGAAEYLGIHPRQVIRWFEIGLSIWQADQVATSMGMHPSAIWADWWDNEILGEAG